jgi:succinoglycan biosynthesis protein ExoM
LRRLLEELDRQETKGLFTFSAVIVDNDCMQSAKAVVDEVAPRLGYEMSYHVEARQNISLARNKALAHARGNAVAFIDDDEYPASTWLLELYKTCQEKNVDAVLGPVMPSFEQEPPAWVRRGKFHERASHPNGPITDWRDGRTGNLLFRKDILDGVEMPFRPEFTTGEDQDFTRRMMENGRTFYWCNEALAHEVVPAIRWNLWFMIRRALLRGKISLRQKGTGLASVGKSALAIPLYAVALPFMLVVGKHVFIKYFVAMFDHVGKVGSFLGINVAREQYITE